VARPLAADSYSPSWIEDAVVGVRAARQAGAQVIAMATGHPEQLEGAGAACVVRSLSELAQLLE
jgi:beta-phosphoglucomutase-like phosphatase (HAD superfamily)